MQVLQLLQVYLAQQQLADQLAHTISRLAVVQVLLKVQDKTQPQWAADLLLPVVSQSVAYKLVTASLLLVQQMISRQQPTQVHTVTQHRLADLVLMQI